MDEIVKIMIVNLAGGSQPDKLQEVQVPVMSNSDCGKVYGSSQITSKMICAGTSEGGKDSCQVIYNLKTFTFKFLLLKEK